MSNQQNGPIGPHPSSCCQQQDKELDSTRTNNEAGSRWVTCSVTRTTTFLSIGISKLLVVHVEDVAMDTRMK